jgi:hypothetical protein
MINNRSDSLVINSINANIQNGLPYYKEALLATKHASQQTKSELSEFINI